MKENRRILTERFAELLFAQYPASVLDLACGDGWLLRAASERGVPVMGVEQSSAELEAAARDGLRVVRADACRLSFADDAFDWVAFRNAAHHLSEPERALREAWRVARTGLVVAEPYYELSDPDQRTGLAFDRWLKRQHVRRGMVHRENLTADELSAPLDGAANLDIEHVLPGRSYTPEQFDDLSHRACAGEPPTNAREELKALRAAAVTGHLPIAGSLILIARKQL